MDKDFEEFKTEFTKWQKLFGLTGYKVYFKCEPLTDCFADITVNQHLMVATVRLSNDSVDTELRDVKQSAKHEAIHLLLYRLEHRTVCRFLHEEEVDEAVEELVFKLENLIKEI